MDEKLEQAIQRDGLIAVLERWAAHVEIGSDPDGCWIWKTHRERKRRIGADPAGSFRSTPAYRAGWRLLRFPIPVGMWVLHNCPGGDNRRCVNPDHHFLGTHHDNYADVRRKQGKRGPYTDGQRDAVLALRSSGRTRVEIARETGLSQQTVQYIFVGGHAAISERSRRAYAENRDLRAAIRAQRAVTA